MKRLYWLGVVMLLSVFVIATFFNGWNSGWQEGYRYGRDETTHHIYDEVHVHAWSSYDQRFNQERDHPTPGETLVFTPHELRRHLLEARLHGKLDALADANLPDPWPDPNGTRGTLVPPGTPERIPMEYHVPFYHKIYR